MPLTEKTIKFGAERERLQEQMEDLASQQVELQDKGRDEKVQEVLIQGNELNNQRNILGHLADEWDMDSVTLAGLTAGEVNLVEDVVEDYPEVRERDAWVAIGTIDAPYLAHNPDGVTRNEYETTIQNVMDLPLPYVRWAEGKISELSHLGADMGNGYLRLVADKQGET